MTYVADKPLATGAGAWPGRPDDRAGLRRQLGQLS